MTKVIPMNRTKSKAQLVAEHINYQLDKHRSAYADILERNPTDKRASFDEINASYKRSVKIIEGLFPNRVHNFHYLLFEQTTESFLHHTIMKHAWTALLKLVVPAFILLTCIAAILLLS
jgi:hypothetical protein